MADLEVLVDDYEEEDSQDAVELLELLQHALQLEEASAEKKRPKKSRNPSFFDQRLGWSEYCDKHVNRGTFKPRLRMEKASFDKLLSYIYQDLLVNEQMARLRGGSIIPELCLYCCLRWLSGGSYLDVTDVAGISNASFYRVVWKTIAALVKCPELKMKFPTTDSEVQAAIAGFAHISDNNIITNCAGVGDGYLLRIKVPKKKEVGNVRSYFSGHYQCYGINIQAVCDYHSRFSFLAMAAPGVSKDCDAAKQCGLIELINGLPRGICVIFDAAYEPSEHVVPVYQGLDKFKPKYHNFNYYASQCRIGVEMAFGLMVNKFGVLQRPLGVKLSNVKWMTQAIGRLHNFVINERLAAKQKEDQNMSQAVAQGRGFLPSTPHDENGDPIDLDVLFDHESVPTYRGHSELRKAMVKRVEKYKMTRPASNKRKQNDGDNHD